MLRQTQENLWHAARLSTSIPKRQPTWFGCAVISLMLSILGTGCEVWQPPIPSPAEYGRGLVVMYPGSTNTRSEMIGFYFGLRESGIDQAIEVVPWSLPLVRFVLGAGFFAEQQAWAMGEAARISEYRSRHPNAPVTLLGFSGGAMAAILVVEALPEGDSVDRVILLSAGVSSQYDLSVVLERSAGGVFVYWSPLENFAQGLANSFGTVDGDFSRPAAVFGFTMSHPMLTQLSWDASMRDEFGNNGDHFDYFLNVAWIRRYIAPWVAVSSPAADGQ